MSANLGAPNQPSLDDDIRRGFRAPEPATTPWPWPVPEDEFPRVGEKALYIGATDTQVNWGNTLDLRPLLTVGDWYYISKVEVHSWHTKVWIGEGDLGPFNSICFSRAPA